MMLNGHFPAGIDQDPREAPKPNELPIYSKVLANSAASHLDDEGRKGADSGQGGET